MRRVANGMAGSCFLKALAGTAHPADYELGPSVSSCWVAAPLELDAESSKSLCSDESPLAAEELCSLIALSSTSCHEVPSGNEKGSVMDIVIVRCSWSTNVLREACRL